MKGQVFAIFQAGLFYHHLSFVAVSCHLCHWGEVGLVCVIGTWVGMNFSMTSLEKPDHDKSQILHQQTFLHISWQTLHHSFAK